MGPAGDIDPIVTAVLEEAWTQAEGDRQRFVDFLNQLTASNPPLREYIRQRAMRHFTVAQLLSEGYRIQPDGRWEPPSPLQR